MMNPDILSYFARVIKTLSVNRKTSHVYITLQRVLPFFGMALLVACNPGQAEERRDAPVAKLLVVPKPLVKADRILVDKSDRTLILYKADKEVYRYASIRFGDEPVGHKQFEGDEKTPEGNYTINGRNPGSAYTLSLRISYPNATDRAYAKSKGKSPGGDIFIHGQPNGWSGPTIARDWTDGCIALSNDEIKLLWKQVDDGTPITIRP
jgi:lipoprotein-anchoring transpeptidase ErfK/SrfK